MKRRLLEKGHWAEVTETTPTYLSVSLQGISFPGCLAKPHIQCGYEPTWIYILPYIPECPSVKYCLCIQGWKIVWLLGQNICNWFSRAFLFWHVGLPIRYLEKWYEGQKIWNLLHLQLCWCFWKLSQSLLDTQQISIFYTSAHICVSRSNHNEVRIMLNTQVLLIIA